MKVLTVALGLAMIACVQSLTTEQKQKLKSHKKICMEETKVSAELCENLKKGNFEDDSPKTKSYILCVMKRTGVMNDAGKFQKDVALAKIGDEDREKFEKVINVCVVDESDDPGTTAFNYAKCFHREKKVVGLVINLDDVDSKDPVADDGNKEKAPVAQTKPAVEEKKPDAEDKQKDKQKDKPKVNEESKPEKPVVDGKKP